MRAIKGEKNVRDYSYLPMEKMDKTVTTNSKKKKINKITILIVSIILLVLICSLFVLKNIFLDLPQPDTFYLATYGGEPVIYFRGEDTKTMVWMMYMMGQMSLSMQNNEYYYMGNVVDFENDSQSQPIREMNTIDFRKLQNPRKLFVYDRYATFINVLENPDKTYIVFSYNGGPSDETNYIYQVNLKTLESKELWQHQIYMSSPPFNKGAAFVMQFIPDKYVVFDIVANNPPPAELPAATVIVNMQTGIEKTLTPAGDIHINLNTNTFSYKLLGKTPILCEKPTDPVCFPTDKYKWGFEPLGNTLTQSLP